MEDLHAIATEISLPPSSSPEELVEILFGQLHRYAEDFGLLSAEYTKLLVEFQRINRERRILPRQDRELENTLRDLADYGFVMTDHRGLVRELSFNLDELFERSAVHGGFANGSGAWMPVICPELWSEELRRFADPTVIEIGGRAQPDVSDISRRLSMYALRPTPNGPIYWIFRKIKRTRREDRTAEIADLVFDSGSEAMLVTDAQGVIRCVNPAFTAITGYQPEEVIGKSPELLQSGQHSPTINREMWQILRQTGEWQGEIVNRRKDGELYTEWLHFLATRDVRGTLKGFVGIFFDTRSARRYHNRICELSHFDVLTGLPNRTLFMEQLQHILDSVDTEREHLVLLLLDMDNFKEINDIHGHEFGDVALQAFAAQLDQHIHSTDLLARFGDDEFAVVFRHIAPGGAGRVAEGLLQVLRHPVTIDEQELNLGASMGICIYPENGRDLQELLKNAAIALHEAKKSGGDGYRFFSEQLNLERSERLALEAALHKALPYGEFFLVYQPQVNAEDGRIVGVEALLRWHNQEFGLLGPDRFIPIVEEIGLILPISYWILRKACDQQVTWKQQGLTPVQMAVNVSALQLGDPFFERSVLDIVQETGIEPAHLELEITETQLMENLHLGIDKLNRLQSLGIGIAIDDFGTGYSSLARLRSLPVSKLKIDKSFLRNIHADPYNEAIVTAILSMAHRLDLKTIAEGVENVEQIHYLVQHRCKELQGYYFSRPLAVEALESLLTGGGVLSLPPVRMNAA